MNKVKEWITHFPLMNYAFPVGEPVGEKVSHGEPATKRLYTQNFERKHPETSNPKSLNRHCRYKEPVQKSSCYNLHGGGYLVYHSLQCIWWLRLFLSLLFMNHLHPKRWQWWRWAATAFAGSWGVSPRLAFRLDQHILLVRLFADHLVVILVLIAFENGMDICFFKVRF